MVTIQHGYPVENAMVGTTITAYQGRAADSLGLASAAALNDSDRSGLELLRNEFISMQRWSEMFVAARRSSSAANIVISQNGLDGDAEVQS